MKVSRFTNIIRGQQYLLHNTMYGTMLRVNSAEGKKLIDRLTKSYSFEDMSDSSLLKTLKEQHIIVEDDADELALLEERLREKEPNRLHYTMIVTRKCNFACPYCLQYTLNKPCGMSRDIYQKSIRMIKAAAEKGEYNEVSIAFFGGEPTLELDNIQRFLTELREALREDIAITGHITSNGYLLTKSNVEGLIGLGIKSFQITLDGFESTHDASRFLQDGRGTWAVIVDNLRSWKELSGKFTVTIRTNFTEEILADADRWIDFLMEEFGGDNRFHMYFEAVKSNGNKDAKTCIVPAEGLNIMGNLLAKAKRRGLPTGFYSSALGLRGLVCKAGDPKAFVIDCDGVIKKCSLYLDDSDNQVGILRDDGCEITPGSLEWWTRFSTRSECMECSIYPLCLGKKCPAAYNVYDVCSCAKGIYNQVLRALYMPDEIKSYSGTSR